MKKILCFALSFVMALSLFACGKKTEEPADNAKPGQTVDIASIPAKDIPISETYTTATGVVVPMPEGYDKMLTLKDQSGRDNSYSKIIISAYENKSLEAAEKLHPGVDYADGWLFNIIEVTRLGYESMASMHSAGYTFFAKSTDGTRYFINHHAPNPRMTREDAENPDSVDEWKALAAWAADIQNLIIEKNEDIVAFDMDSVMNGYTYPGEHLFMTCEVENFLSEPETVVVVLSRPSIAQNAVWAAERIESYSSFSSNPEVTLVFPSTMGEYMTADEFYDEQQKTMDAGWAPQCATPEGALEMLLESPAWEYSEIGVDAFTATTERPVISN